MMAQQGLRGVAAQSCVYVQSRARTCIYESAVCARAQMCPSAQQKCLTFAARVYLRENKLAIMPRWSSLIYMAE